MKKEIWEKSQERDKERRHVMLLWSKYVDEVVEKCKEDGSYFEPRFTKVKCSPYKKVAPDDSIYIKESPGKLLYKVRATRAEYYSDLKPSDIRDIKEEYNEDFGDEESNYASLIFFDNLKKIDPPVDFPRQYGAGWIVIEEDGKYWDVIEDL